MHQLRAIFLPLGVAAILGPAAFAGEAKDATAFVKNAFKDKIDEVKGQIYCRALSCELDIESFTATEGAPKSYVFDVTGWLEGTVPALKGSARRTVTLTANYTRGTCVIKDVKPLSDATANNNGWGASKIDAAFRVLLIPETIIMTPEDCKTVDGFLEALSSPDTKIQPPPPQPSPNLG